MENVIHPDFNESIDSYLCCGNCLYKLMYSYTSRGEKLHSSVYMNKHNRSVVCLIDKEPMALNSSNQFDKQMTCHMHDLGSFLEGTELHCPTNLEAVNNNSTLKVLFNLRPDIVQRFNNIDILQEYESNKWNSLKLYSPK